MDQCQQILVKKSVGQVRKINAGIVYIPRLFTPSSWYYLIMALKYVLRWKLHQTF